MTRRSRWAWIDLDRGSAQRRPGARLPARRRDQQPRTSTSATTCGCSGSTSRWRARSSSVIVVAGVRMLWRVSRGRFGSRLLLKLAAIFALVGVAARRASSTRSATSSSRARSRAGSTCKRRRRARRRPEPRPRHDRLDRRRPRDQDAAGRRAARRERGRRPSRSALERLREQLSARDVSIVGSAGQTLITTGARACSG